MRVTKYIENKYLPVLTLITRVTKAAYKNTVEIILLNEIVSSNFTITEYKISILQYYPHSKFSFISGSHQLTLWNYRNLLNDFIGYSLQISMSRD